MTELTKSIEISEPIKNGYYMIVDVWSREGNIAFVPEDEFKQYFKIYKNDYAILQESEFKNFYFGGSDTYMQGCILGHARSGIYYGQINNLLIRNVYIWKDDYE